MRAMFQIVFALTTLLAIPAAAQHLTSGTRDATYKQVFIQGEVFPVWGGTFLLTWKSSTTTADHGDNVFLFRRDGQLQSKTRLWLHDASSIHIAGAAGSEKGSDVVFFGNAWDASGLVAGFFAQITGDGQVSRVVRTAPFEPKAAAFSADGSIWLFGLQAGPDRKLATAPQHALIQRYQGDGRLLGQYLPSTDWRCEGKPHPAGKRARILAAGDRIAVISEECWEMTELSFSGEVIARHTLPPAPGQARAGHAPILAAAMTTSGLYARFAGPGIYRWSPGKSAWQHIGVGMTGSQQADLLGADGDSLVVHDGNGRVSWRSVVE